MRELGRCGTVRVLEDRTAGGEKARTLALRVAVLPARGLGPEGAPIVFLNGGPGAGSVEGAGYAADALGPLRARHALVFVDQRGTGASAPLRCSLFDGTLQASVDPSFPAAAVRHCRDALARRRNLANYVTADAADDLVAVLDTLGVRRAVLFGVSYGGRLALTVLRRHPDRVAAVIAQSASPPERVVPLAAGWAGARAIAARAAACRADSSCRSAAPRPMQDLQTVLARLAAGPVRLTRWNGRRLRREEVVVTRRAFAEASYAMLYNPDRARSLFGLVHRAAGGDWRPWLDAAVRRGRWRAYRGNAGLTLNVLCTEDAPRLARALASSADAARLAAGPLGLPLAPEIVAACAGWPRGRVASEDTLPVRAAAPVLFLSGALDPITPPEWADSAAAFLPAAVHLVRPGAGHAGVDACVRDVIERFVNARETSVVAAGAAAQRAPCAAAWWATRQDVVATQP